MQIAKIKKSALKKEVQKLRTKRLITISATVEGKDFVLFYQFNDPKDVIMLALKFPKKENQVDSIIQIFPGANIMEREIHDLFGIDFEGNPNMNKRLFLADEWEEKAPRRDER